MTDDEPSSSVRIRDMPWPEFMKLLRSIGAEVGRLQERGDQTAKMVMARYVYACNHPSDVEANHELRVAVEDYISRDLRQAEQIELGSRYGHRLPEPEKETGPRIFVPNQNSEPS